MIDSLNILYTSDYVEHHGIKGMKWGVRRQQKRIARIRKQAEKSARGMEKMSLRWLNDTKNKSLNKIKKYEKKQNKIAKPYADSSGHFKITNPNKAQKHYLLSEKIVNEKKRIKRIDEILKNGSKNVNKKYSDTSMSYIHQQVHQNAVQQHMNFMHQVQQQNTLQSIQNFHNQMHFDMINNMNNIHMHNMHTMGMF